MITVILPAAGGGSRLGLPYSKEIMHVSMDKSLIDFSFDHFRHCKREDVEFVVIINESKTDIIRYLANYRDLFNISFTYQHPLEREYTGALKSAQHLFGETNLVLLPDTILTLPSHMDMVEVVQEAIGRKGFCFLHKYESDTEVLRTKGALSVRSGGLVTAYEDKPKNSVQRYNAFWCGFAFNRRVFNRAIKFMEESTLGLVRKIDIKETPLFRCESVQVLDYVDLGTWPEVQKWFRNNPSPV